jgi:aspartokinase
MHIQLIIDSMSMLTSDTNIAVDSHGKHTFIQSCSFRLFVVDDDMYDDDIDRFHRARQDKQHDEKRITQVCAILSIITNRMSGSDMFVKSCSIIRHDLDSARCYRYGSNISRQ